MSEAEGMTDAQIRSYILGRFKLKSSLASNGRVATAMIWGSGSKRPPVLDFERVLKAMRDEGTLACTNGFWWKR